MINTYYKIRPTIIGIITLYLILIISGVSAEGSASVYIWPNSGTFNSDFTVDVRVSSADEEMNSISGTIVFPTDKLNVVSLSNSGSIVDTWISGPAFSNSAGEVSFGGITLNTPFKGSDGKVLSIKFRPIGSGDASVRFSSASVLANDLIGTEMLIGAGKGTYTLTASGEPIPVEEPVVEENPVEEPVVEENPNLEPEVPVDIEEIDKPIILRPAPDSFNENGGLGEDNNMAGSEENTENNTDVNETPPNEVESMSEIERKKLAKLLPRAPKVDSPTHPDTETAYANNNPTFTWPITNDIVGVNFLADQNPDTLLNEKSHGLMTSYVYEDVEDGEWYFHIRLQNKTGWGNTTHRKFIVDMSATSMDNEASEMVGAGGDGAQSASGLELKSSASSDDNILSGSEGNISGETEVELVSSKKLKKDVWLKWEYLKNMPLTYIVIMLLILVIIAESIILAGVLFKKKGKKSKKKSKKNNKKKNKKKR